MKTSLTKAKSLEYLKAQLKTSQVLDLYYFTANQWEATPAEILNEINNKWPLNTHGEIGLIVRSSALGEDSNLESKAGCYESVLNIKTQEQLSIAIKQVLGSYTANVTKPNPLNEVLVQPMLQNVRRSGVIFTKDPANGGHYYVINVDDSSGRTDTVTGSGDNLRTFYVSHTWMADKTTSWVSKLINSCKEIEEVLGVDKSSALDIEFAFNNDEELYIFQARPLILKQPPRFDLEQQKLVVRQIKNKISSLAKKIPFIAGEQGVFGVMPDWNPAEIIGVRPRPLALSLYKELITDSVWAESRTRFGYRNLRGVPLLVSLGGMPYVDVRASFNSFIPQELDDRLANKLVNFYLNSLRENPNNHDKVEFEVIFSCYTFDFDERSKKLINAGFSLDEVQQLKTGLLNLTNKIIHNETGLWKLDYQTLDFLKQKHLEVTQSNLNEIEKIYWLLEDCKRYGTLPFAGLARSGFVAVQMLRSLVSQNIIDKQDYEDFLNSLETVSSKMSYDLNDLSRDEFLHLYGHIRPGTYDLLCPRYDEAPDQYFNFEQRQEEHPAKPVFTLSLEKLGRMESFLIQHQIHHTPLSLFRFFKGAIEGREYAKFLFTKNLSDSMVLLSELGKRFEICDDDLSYCDISIIKYLYSTTNRFQPTINWSIEMGKKVYNKITKNITLPPLIFDESSVEFFELPQNEPNFITLKSAMGPRLTLDNKSQSFAGAIVMIPAADPGYDWIFTKSIAGFVTMYGGINSHMAIRAQELGIPAVIGAGELLYKRWEKSEILKIECVNKMVQIIK